LFFQIRSFLLICPKNQKGQGKAALVCPSSVGSSKKDQEEKKAAGSRKGERKGVGSTYWSPLWEAERIHKKEKGAPFREYHKIGNGHMENFSRGVR